ncbi:unnamed protein product [Adineta steineri]|uniref:Uncharacterized protein n=1 Tax=Adineta steineri TaxID=433720 RepID=A0A814GL45_9BILA|nr:unnamed protein product [Adineta steineri]CAF0997936.1 unnamed protein product [Adineta steineri]
MGFISRYGNDNNMTSPMDRLYGGISEQINISSNELRQMSVKRIRENSDYYVTMLSAVYMLAEYENKGLLYIGRSNNKNKKNEEIIEEHHNKALSKSDNKKLICAIEKFIDSFDVDQIDVAKQVVTSHRYNIDGKFNIRPPFGTENRNKFLDSLDNKELEIVAPDRGVKLGRGNPRGILRLDCQGMVGDRPSMNLQIQYRRDNGGRSGSYKNAILPGNHYLGLRIIINNTLNCYLPANQYINFRSSVFSI